MKRKIGTSFIENDEKYLVCETQLSYPKKCRQCGFYAKKTCNGVLDVTGGCLPTREDKAELFFKKIKNKIQ